MAFTHLIPVVHLILPFFMMKKNCYLFNIMSIFDWLTNNGLVAPNGECILVNIGTGNGLLFGATKSLPELTLTYHHVSFIAFN